MDNSERTEKRGGGGVFETSAGASSKPVQYRMRLFVAGDEPNSTLARKNLKDICESELKGNYSLDIIDVFEDYAPALDENILVTPALVIDHPKKMKIFGNLQDKSKALSALGVK